MMEHQRSPIRVEQSHISLTPKRHKADISFSFKEKKEKITERVAALQQLVCPYGKTDTASVLSEATDYIQFLHEQVKVLSGPYLQTYPLRKTQECNTYNLRSKGLCLMPISCTDGFVSNNGADIWAPVKAGSPKSCKAEQI